MQAAIRAVVIVVCLLSLSLHHGNAQVGPRCVLMQSMQSLLYGCMCLPYCSAATKAQESIALLVTLQTDMPMTF